MSVEIQAKQYLGDRSLIKVMIEPEVGNIGRWAYMGCKALTEIWIPAGCAVAENVFEGCTSLERVMIYEAGGKGAAVNISPELLACLIKAEPAECGEWIKRAADNELFIDKLDGWFPAFLSEDDFKGYDPFLAGGEEDYDNEDVARSNYGLSVRRNKLKMIYERFLTESRGSKLAGEKRPVLDKYIRDHASEAFELLVTEISRKTAYRSYFFENGLGEILTKEEMLKMAGDDVSLKAMVLSERIKNDQGSDEGGLGMLSISI